MCPEMAVSCSIDDGNDDGGEGCRKEIFLTIYSTDYLVNRTSHTRATQLTIFKIFFLTLKTSCSKIKSQTLKLSQNLKSYSNTAPPAPRSEAEHSVSRQGVVS